MVEHTLLHYSPRCDRGERYASRRWLAWPTWAFRVIVPQPFPGGLNCLQRVVLGVLRASALTHDELGQRLGLAPALIAHIERELLGMGYLEEGRRLTARGAAHWPSQRRRTPTLRRPGCLPTRGVMACGPS